MKWKLWITIILFATCGMLLTAQQEDSTIIRLENIKNMVKVILKEVNDLGKLAGRNEIITALKKIKSDFENIKLRDQSSNNEIIQVLDKCLEDANVKVGSTGNFREESSEFAKKIKAKFNELIKKIDYSIKLRKKEILQSENQSQKNNGVVGAASPGIGFKQIFVFAILLFFANLLAGVVLYYAFFRHDREKAVNFYGLAHKRLNEFYNDISVLKQKITGIKDEMESRLELLNNNVRDIILILKEYGEHMLDQEHPGSGHSGGTAPWDDDSGRSTSPQPSPMPGETLPPDIALSTHGEEIEFPQSLPGAERWVGLLMSEFKRNRQAIESLVAKAAHGVQIKEWIEKIGKQMVESIHYRDDERAFFEKILPSLRTLKKQLKSVELADFKEAFFDGFLKALEIVEIGTPGEPFRPDEHKFSGSEQRSGESRVTHVIEHGYKKKHADGFDPIIKKALVEC